MPTSLRHFPDSIAARVAAMTLIGIAVFTTSVLTFMRFPSLHGLVPDVLGGEAEAVAEVVWMVENVPEDLEEYVLSIYRGSARYAQIVDEFPDDLQEISSIRTQIINADTDAASRLESRKILFGTKNIRLLKRLRDRRSKEGIVAVAALVVGIELNDGRVMVIDLAPYLYLTSGQVVRTFTVVLFFILIVQTITFALVILRPIRRLERDADQVGLAQLGLAVTEAGPFEIKRIASALNRMRTRLANLVQEREQIIVAIAHDVRTSITKIRLRMDVDGKIEAQDLEADLAQMETLVTDMMTYARAESPNAPSEVIDLKDFVVQQASNMPFDVEVIDETEGRPFAIVGDTVALTRLLDNLLENARRYGEPPVTITINVTDDCEIRVRDRGTGLPEHLLEQVFQPFARGETSRNRETGGSGLGLGIARTIARAHGAALNLENHPEGGLEAVVTFPNFLKT